jgi:hypothetical protein
MIFVDRGLDHAVARSTRSMGRRLSTVRSHLRSECGVGGSQPVCTTVLHKTITPSRWAAQGGFTLGGAGATNCLSGKYPAS